MKKRTLHLMALVLATLSILTLGSCTYEEFHRETPGRLLVVDDNDVTHYDLYLLNAEKGAIYSINADDNFNLSSIDILYDQGGKMLNISHYDDGLIRSISSKDYTLTFSNYEKNMVDVAIIFGEDFIMQKGYEGNVNWDKFRHSSDIPTRAAGFGPTFDSFADWVADGSFNRTMTDEDSYVQQLIGQARDIIDLSNYTNDKEALKGMTMWLIDIVNDGIIDMALDQDQIANIVSNVETAYDMITDGVNVWNSLTLVLDNYDNWVDLSANLWERFFEWQDERTSNEELGLATLNSGSGSLKVTLSWNFYADIDLYAYEPSGELIYYDNKRSAHSDGYLDIDNRYGGAGATENIYWEHPADGTYVFCLDYYGASTYNGMSQSGNCKVTILHKGQGKVYNIPMSEFDYQNVSAITLPSGTITRAGDGQSSVTDIIIKVKTSAKPKP